MNKTITMDDVKALFVEVNKAKALVEEKVTEAITAFMNCNRQRGKGNKFYMLQNEKSVMGMVCGILMCIDGKVFLTDSVKDAHVVAPISSLLLSTLEDILFEIQGGHGEFVNEDVID